jgi:hypothetical protein
VRNAFGFAHTAVHRAMTGGTAVQQPSAQHCFYQSVYRMAKKTAQAVRQQKSTYCRADDSFVIAYVYYATGAAIGLKFVVGMPASVLFVLFHKYLVFYTYSENLARYSGEPQVSVKRLIFRSKQNVFA